MLVNTNIHSHSFLFSLVYSDALTMEVNGGNSHAYIWLIFG